MITLVAWMVRFYRNWNGRKFDMNNVKEFINFGKMPIANGFLKEEEFEKEYFFELKVGFDPETKLVQLTELVDERKMFHENYAFFSSTSKAMQTHFKGFHDFVSENYISETDPFVVEIGSNDGILIQNFAKRGVRHLGVEPSANVAAVAIEKGIRCVSEFFTEDLAEKIIAENGHADAIMSANCICHIPYLDSVFGGIEKLLKPKGVFVFEDPYLGDIIEKVSYDQIYDEHVYYFCVHSISQLAEKHGMEVINVLPQNVHGGSMRYVIAKKGAYQVSASVMQQKNKEEQLGLLDFSTYVNFRERVEASRDKLIQLLDQLKSEGKRVVAYAATSKSTTVTNYCGITPEHVEFISDTTPIKQGKYSPGAHIPVKAYNEFKNNYPDYALLFGWNHAKEIMDNEKEFSNSGGKWILYVPEVSIL